MRFESTYKELKLPIIMTTTDKSYASFESTYKELKQAQTLNQRK